MIYIIVSRSLLKSSMDKLVEIFRVPCEIIEQAIEFLEDSNPNREFEFAELEGATYFLANGQK